MKKRLDEIKFNCILEQIERKENYIEKYILENLNSCYTLKHKDYPGDIFLIKNNNIFVHVDSEYNEILCDDVVWITIGECFFKNKEVFFIDNFDKLPRSEVLFDIVVDIMEKTFKKYIKNNKISVDITCWSFHRCIDLFSKYDIIKKNNKKKR